MKRWSKLKRDVECLMAPKLDFKIYANAYNIEESIPVPRFWITVGGKIIWDWPKDYIEQEGWYFYDSTIKISQLLRDYLNTPESELLSKQFEDPFRLVPILRVCDKRIGEKQLENLLENPDNFEIAFIISNRLSHS
ncbi:MAG: hypothetical protein J1E16_04835 [Muribaculaceae bacterium]|nr:hypothetical protein [Muribaculaceae bacterium]